MAMPSSGGQRPETAMVNSTSEALGGHSSDMKRFLLWDYPRAGWQYDIMVVLILGFIFLTPRAVFRDQPRASNIVRLPEENGANVFFMEPELISPLPESERNSKVESMLRSRFGKREMVVRLLPLSDSEDEIKGYLAYTRPQ